MSKNSPTPKIPDHFPTIGNAFTQGFGQLILRALRWNIVGTYPNTARMVVAAAPHTSNWDFVIGMACMFAMGFRAHWLGKHSIFIWPFNRLLRSFGGIPVVRHAASNMVDQVADQFKSNEKMILAIAPEGTRKRVEKLKTGFVRIAVAADVPIWMIAFDYQKRQLILGDLYYPTGDLEVDEAFVRSYFYQFQPKHVDQYCPK